jgi:hypothetical protein
MNRREYPQRQHPNPNGQSDSRRNGDRQQLALAIHQTISEPMLRWADDPRRVKLSQRLMGNPFNAPLQRQFNKEVEKCQIKAMASGCPYYQNPPPPGFLSQTPNSIRLCQVLPTEDIFSIPTQEFSKNVLVVGASGGGKTNNLRIIITGLVEAGATVVCFDRKGDLLDCKILSNPKLPIIARTWEETPIALLQPPTGIGKTPFVTTFVEILAAHLDLFASRRIMLETLHMLFQREKEKNEGGRPTLTKWIEMLSNIQAKGFTRQGQYKEASLLALKEIAWAFESGIIDYEKSSLVEKITAFQGCTVIETGGLSARVASIYTSVFINWAYERRGIERHERGCFFILEDSLPLVTGSHAKESEGGINPLSNWAFMGRSRNMGLIVSAQNFGLISPALRNNTDNIIVCSSSGEDIGALARHLQLTREQAAKIFVLQPGEVIVFSGSVHPLPMFGISPLVK